MRLWHKDLISILPRQQLLGQWRECCLIAKNIYEKGGANHILVNRIMDYQIDHFFRYCIGVKEELTRRGYICHWEKILPYFVNKQYSYIRMENIFPNWHNDRYLRECLYNLEEKAICNGINKQEWDIIVERYGDKFDLWKG